MLADLASFLEYYVFHPPLHALVAISIPCAITLACILYTLYHRRFYWKHEVILVGFSAALSVLGSFYEDTDYHVLPVYPVLAIFAAGLSRQPIQPGLMYAGTFITTLIPDLFAAWHIYHSYAIPVGRWYYGLGLNGFLDALFLYPFATILVVPFANKQIRQGGGIPWLKQKAPRKEGL